MAAPAARTPTPASASRSTTPSTGTSSAASEGARVRGRPFEGAAQVDGCADCGRTPYPVARSGQDRLALQSQQGRCVGGRERPAGVPEPHVAVRPLPLIAMEYRLLAELSANAGRLLTYEHLLERVWGEKSSGDVRPMRTIVSKLRRKLGDDADNPTYIFTEPRVGYRMPKGETQEREEA